MCFRDVPRVAHDGHLLPGEQVLGLPGRGGGTVIVTSGILIALLSRLVLTRVP
jgi:hypothetical protein